MKKLESEKKEILVEACKNELSNGVHYYYNGYIWENDNGIYRRYSFKTMLYCDFATYTDFEKAERLGSLI